MSGLTPIRRPASVPFADAPPLHSLYDRVLSRHPALRDSAEARQALLSERKLLGSVDRARRSVQGYLVADGRRFTALRGPGQPPMALKEQLNAELAKSRGQLKSELKQLVLLWEESRGHIATLHALAKEPAPTLDEPSDHHKRSQRSFHWSLPPNLAHDRSARAAWNMAWTIHQAKQNGTPLKKAELAALWLTPGLRHDLHERAIVMARFPEVTAHRWDVTPDAGRDALVMAANVPAAEGDAFSG